MPEDKVSTSFSQPKDVAKKPASKSTPESDGWEKCEPTASKSGLYDYLFKDGALYRRLSS